MSQIIKHNSSSFGFRISCGLFPGPARPPFGYIRIPIPGDSGR